MICNGIISHSLWKLSVAILEASDRSVAILDSPQGKREVMAQKELKDKLYDTCIFTAMQWEGGCPAAMAVELIKHVHLINFDVLEGIWPPEGKSHEFHNETQMEQIYLQSWEKDPFHYIGPRQIIQDHHSKMNWLVTLVLSAILAPPLPCNIMC